MLYNQRGLLLTSPGIPPTPVVDAQSHVTIHTPLRSAAVLTLHPLEDPLLAPVCVFTLRMVLPPTLPHPSTPSSHPLSPHRQRGRLVLLHSCSAHLSTIVVVVVVERGRGSLLWSSGQARCRHSKMRQVVLVLRNTRPLSYEVSVERTSDKKLSCLHIPKVRSNLHLKDS